ncbi:cobyrinate a,c-diamide synthase [Metabacillus fastidiosus]|uniref:Cobyrinate a,c-diamide synthase n=1 Tax=Metabacillus fastidiosus TaxID=1458 RepID=A0ABU6NZ63_9BACI|nr:cobyrinate a,c-diamide synthase [Metabacillus fastidiosus]MED4401973.1 cobyrinate a,c-diamide synthase [Metabacillus fastidiosus]
MSNHRFVIAGTGSGVGKTTLTIGLMSAFMKKGLTVQGFKCGPDYIDPTYHKAVTKRPSRNLDSWMLDHDVVKEIFYNGSRGADLSIIEGVMGFFDGKNPLTNSGTTAELSMILETPVVLVVNCASMARSAAAIVKGFQVFAEGPNIVAVIANNVGSEGHYKIVKSAIEKECEIPVVGYLKRNAELSIPERHLGLVPSVERGELDPFFDQLGELVSESIDLDQLYELVKAPPVSIETNFFGEKYDTQVRIAVAKDAAFNFYYEENLDLLKAFGAELVEFSPVKGEVLPDNVQGLYLGGGFPEEFASELAGQHEMKQSIRQAIERGIPTLAECGGFMFLTENIETTDKEQFEMLGIIKGSVRMQTKRAALGYREIKGDNFLLKGELEAKGHEFHYSTFHPSEEITDYAYEVKGMRGVKKEGVLYKNVVAGYTHFHFASCPEMVENWISACKEYRENE